MSIEQLETRLRRAERRIAALGLALGLAVAAAAYLLLRPADTLRVTSLELAGANGGTVARLGRADGRTGLFLLDDRAVERVAVFHADDADGLYVNDGEGVTRIGIAQFAHGGGGVALHGQGSHGAAVLYYKEAGSLRLFDREGKVVNEMTEVRAE